MVKQNPYLKEDAGEEPLHKYDTPYLSDPLVRCDNCAKLVLVQFVNKHSGCNHCGNKRFQQLYSMNGEELNALRDQEYDLGMKYEIDPEFLAIFQAVGEDENDG